MNIIPTIARLVPKNNTMRINQAITLYCAKAVTPYAIILQKRLLQCGVTLELVPMERAFISLVCLSEGFSNKDMYKIEISESGIKATYCEDNGASLACVTLYHIMRNAWANGGLLECMSIEDYPRYSHRGVHLDTARHYFAPSEIMKIIEQLSLIKINTLHWHFADDQAWRLEILQFPNLTKSCKGDYYTQEKVQEIVSFAKERGVSVVPEIEIPGHSTAAIAAYPWLGCAQKQLTAPTTGGIFKDILCAGKPSTYTFIEKVLGEICALFPSRQIHLGGDEAPKDKWARCPHCAKKMQQLGVHGYEELQGHMLNFANDILKAHNKKAICWNDCLKANNLNDDIIIQHWAPIAKCKIEKGKHRKTIYSSVFSLYLDYPYSFSNLKSAYNTARTIEKRKDICGVECALWTERIETAERLEYMLFPRCIAVAEIAWGAKGSYKEFLMRLREHYKLLNAAKINAAPLREATVCGVKRAVENMSFLKLMVKTRCEIKAKNKK